ncbi:allatostatin-A receptor-like [Montipora foliosa]|uniref:allatostatin-A receptor-like n=1 Tax=Montipora foliosa TaxID=591990 RepID=UPI0035F20E5E
MSDKYTALNTDRSIGIIIVEVAVCSVIGVLGLFGNVLVSLVVARCPKLRTSTNVFIVGLAVCDIFTVSICAPISSAILISDGWISNSKFLCNLQGFVFQTLASISIATLTLTAINRFVRVVRPAVYKRLFTKRNSLLLICVVWFSVLGLYVSLLVTKSTHVRYEPNYASCLIAHALVQTLVEFAFFVLAFIVIIFCYTLVFKTIRRHQLSLTFPGITGNLNVSLEEIKISKVLLTTFLGFGICWVPILIIMTTDRIAQSHTTPPRTRTLLCTYLNYLSAALNPFIYGIMNRSFRAEYHKILLCRKNSVVTPDISEKNIWTLRNAARASIIWKRFVFPVSNASEIACSPHKQRIDNSAQRCARSLSTSTSCKMVPFSNIFQDSSQDMK